MPAKVPIISDDDPLAHVTAPPPDETPAEREARMRAEAEAKQVSDIIDEELDRQRLAEKRAPKALKVLLLGQSESGKSTTLKNFQIMYDPKAFKTERESWRAVIQLNVVRSVHLILDALTRAQANTYSPSSPSSPSSSKPQNTHKPHLSPELLKVQMRLAPLLQIEQVLMQQLTPVGSGESEPTLLNSSASSYAERSRNILKELAINSTMQWRGAFSRGHVEGNPDADASEDERGPDPNDPGVVLTNCAADIGLLWRDPIVKVLLEKQGLRLEDMAGFFLDSLDRVTAPKYVPTDDDILRARLKTLGVSEHRFTISNEASSVGRDWRVFDVGGHRSLRAAWVPYFDDMDAIIFLAPISCFDQMLAEDPKVNRLEDSIILWTSIVGNKLLKNTNLILFLNKVDIFKAKLASGIKLADHVISYGTRSNDAESTALYLRKKFAGLLKEKSIVPRPFYCHLTTVTDTRSTRKILSNVKDVLMRRNLSEAALLT